MSQNHLRNLEENHLASDRLDDAVRGLQRRDEARLHLCGLLEVIRHVVQQVDDEIEAVGQVHQEVVGLRQEEVLWVRHDHHLGLLKSRFEVVEMDVVVVGQECYLYSLAGLARKQLLLEHTLDGGACV